MTPLICIQDEGCKDCGVCKVREHIYLNYSEEEFDSILNSDTMLDLLVRELIFDEAEADLIINHLKSLKVKLDTPSINNDEIDILGEAEIIGEEVSQIQTQKISKIKYVATDYNIKVKQMEMLDMFFEQLDNSSEGISKTTFLKSISKDNLKGRKFFDDIIRNMLREGILVKVGRQYYLRNNIIQENNYHRKVYHIIYDNEPISSSSILTQLNYRNSKGRRKLLQILKLMYEEDLIKYSLNKWSIKR